MVEPVKLAPRRPVALRECPECGFTMSQRAIEDIQVDCRCPRCGVPKLSDFKAILTDGGRL